MKSREHEEWKYYACKTSEGRTNSITSHLRTKKKYSEQLVKSEELINKKNYAEAKDILNKLVSETKDNKNLEEYNKKR